ncbi:golgin subfamily A member 6-like protein 22 isoform X2 [Ruditapes philippinarum]|uniref:golgin subfamily A member 6-like protein 22 isoform X2 n=1 Tax=Ruditapes philippinarum TaxID=129788 RepID=UPI00295B9B6C|nr:golgin subfamily A member 6-like protein 22 isoform X2 [Ruditapes philippinarum]
MALNERKSAGMLRKISKPVISTDVMGNRNVEVRAVGAWVQAEPCNRQPEGVLAAEEEELRLRQIQYEKQARLKQFQLEVKKRVTKLDRMKKQAQLETNYRAAEHERNIVCQSAFSSQDFAKKDTSLVRPNTALEVEKLNRCKKGYKEKKTHEPVEEQAFFDQTNQVHQHVRHAKKNLMSRQVITDNYVGDNLPGGVWKISKTRDHPSSRYTVDGQEFDILDENLIDKVKVVNNKAFQCIDDDVEDDVDKENVEVMSVHSEELPEKCVKFDIDTHTTGHRNSEIRRSSQRSVYNGTDLTKNIAKVPDIYEGVHCEEEKRRAKGQQAMYRRLFMDLEREQVKENLRRQEHRKRIQKLKKEKEEERVKEEQISKQLIEPRDPVTGETSREALDREEQERQFIRQTIREHERKVRKTKEMERYIEALRQQLKEKTRRKKIDLPPLCCCGETIWDTNPETCANNCVFYKNPKEYGRALQAMLDSSDLAS